MIKWILFFGLILSYKVIMNGIRIIQCKKYMNEYLSWIENKKMTFIQKKHQIIELWKTAGLSDRVSPRTKSMGLGQLVNYRKSVFDSFPSNDEDMAYASMSMFNEAIGVYRNRLLKTVIPLYWIEGLLFLPRILLEYFGSDNKILIKILQGMYWLLGAVFGFIVSVYPDELKKIISTLFKQ